MNKFAVFSGFLGSGKTTTMMALTKYHTAHHGKAAMISNDLGGKGLADNRYAQLDGCNASEITDECICYVNEQLADRLKRYYAEGCELVVSDIPGFGVGALEHVYHGLSEKFPGQFDLGPFTVLTEPKTVAHLREGKGGDLDYLLNTQLVEADLIVLNKRDLLTAEQTEADLTWLREHYPDAEVLSISARTGEGLEDLSQALMTRSASMRRPDIGYGGSVFMEAMTLLSEYYLQYHATVCCNDFDGNAYLTDLARAVQTSISNAGCEIPHLKLLAWTSEGDYGKADLLGTDRPVELAHSFVAPCTEIAVVLNGSAACPYAQLDSLITDAVKAVSTQYQLELMIFNRECFGMGDQE